MALRTFKLCFVLVTMKLLKVFKAQRFNVDMSEFPIISRLSQRLCQLQPFIEAHPDNQIDSPARKK